MIDIEVLGLMITKLQKIYGVDQIIKLELRDYYNIIKPASYYIENQIVFIFNFPIISKDNYDLYRLSIVPNKNSQALIPPYPFIATNEKAFVYIETECPKLDNWFLCEKGIDHQVRTKPDCIHELIIKQDLQELCQFTTITLTREAMEKLDDQHYILSFPKNTKIQLSCTQQDYTSLQGSFLATIPVGCHIKTEELTIVNDNDEIKGQALKLSKIPYDFNQQTITSPHLQLNSINLQGLHRIQDRITIHDPLQIEDDQPNALYHTTLPFYVVSSIACIFFILWIIHRTSCKCNKELKKDQSTRTQNEEIVEPGSVPATFSLNVLK